MKLLRFAPLMVAALAAAPLAGETKARLEDLPPAVQSAVKEQTRNAELTGISKELEKGRTTYEVETKVNGRSRDLVLDKTGALLEVEQEVDLDSIPAAAKAAIQKKAMGGSVTKVETLTAGSKVSFEAAIRTKAGKNIEVGVNADGSPHK